MNRRLFLNWLGKGAAGAAYVFLGGPLPTLTIPDPVAELTPLGPTHLDAINQVMMKRIVPHLADQFFRHSPLLTYAKREVKPDQWLPGLGLEAE